MIKSIIFDFNGTLVNDDVPNRVVWQRIVAEISNNKIDFDSFYEKIKSVKNYLIVKSAFELVNNPQSDDVYNEWAYKKEIYYQKYSIDNGYKNLNKGADELLTYLKQRYTNLGLCTSSILYNTEFYYSNYGIGKYFDMKYTVHDEEKYTNKVMMYSDCAKKLGYDMKDILVFEDSPRSIKDAIDAGCQNIIAIKKYNTPDYPQIKQVINDFTEFDKSILDI